MLQAIHGKYFSFCQILISATAKYGFAYWLVHSGNTLCISDDIDTVVFAYSKRFLSQSCLFADLTPAVNIYCDASNVLIDDAVGQPMANIKIANNHIRNSKTAAIGVQYAKDIEVLDNVIENPMAARLQTAYSNIVPYSYPSAIYLNAVTNATVKSNRINLEDPSSLPEVGQSIFACVITVKDFS